MTCRFALTVVSSICELCAAGMLSVMKVFDQILRNVTSRSFVTDVSCRKHDEGTVSLASHTAKETSLELSWSKLLTKIEC